MSVQVDLDSERYAERVGRIRVKVGSSTDLPEPALDPRARDYFPELKPIGHVRRSCVVVDRAWRIILWYLKDAIPSADQVSTGLSYWVG